MESNRGDERCRRHTQRAHHMRRGQQPGTHRTPHTTHNTHSNPRQQAHTHTQPRRNTNTQMEEGEANRSGTQGSTACTYRESGPSCRHPARRVRIQEEVQRTQQHKSIVTIKKEIPAHHAGCWSTGSAANIHHKQFICSRPSSTFIALNSMQARPPPQQKLLRTQQETKKGVVWETTVLPSLPLCKAVFILLVAVAVSLLNPSLWAAGVTFPADVPSFCRCILLLHFFREVRRPLRSGGSHYDWSWWCWRRR
ncbi:hypothetical protein TCSYLVIO_009514 [Trypanosoma cruzi]|nr:hypothetical protein TCSYLVIO_009514 [Trypanosoma cruzi]